jgi:hypothetical protein
VASQRVILSASVKNANTVSGSASTWISLMIGSVAILGKMSSPFLDLRFATQHVYPVDHLIRVVRRG